MVIDAVVAKAILFFLTLDNKKIAFFFTFKALSFLSKLRLLYADASRHLKTVKIWFWQLPFVKNYNQRPPAGNLWQRWLKKRKITKLKIFIKFAKFKEINTSNTNPKWEMFLNWDTFQAFEKDPKFEKKINNDIFT